MTPTPETRPNPLLTALPWLVLLTFLAVGLRTLSVFEFWSHTATGRAVLQGGLFGPDSLSQLGEGKAWVKAGWLYGTLMYLLQGAGGGLVTLAHLASVGAAFVLLARVARKQAGLLPVGFALLLCLWVLAPGLSASPAVFSLIFPAGMIFLLSTRPKAPATLPVLLLLQVLWVNCHTTFLAGPAIALAFALEAGSGDPKHGTLTRADLPRLLALAGALLAVSLLNPNFHGIFAHVLAPDIWAGLPEGISVTAKAWTQPGPSPFISDFIVKGSPLLINFVMLSAALGLVFYREALPYARTALAVMAAALVMWRYQPTVELFTVLVFPLLALSLGSFGGFLQGVQRQGRQGDKADVMRWAGAGVLAAALLGTALHFATDSYYIRKGMPARFGLGVNNDLFPVEAMAVINRADFPSSFIHFPADGGYLETKLAKGRKAFMDARAALHPTAYEDLVAAWIGTDKEKAEAAFKRLHTAGVPGAVVLNTTLPYAQEVLSRLVHGMNLYRPVYLDGTTAILVTPAAEHAALFADKEARQKGLALMEEAKNNYRKQLGGIPAPVPARLLGTANTLLALNRPAEARSVLSLLRAGNPALYSARLSLALLHSGLKEPEAALAVLEEAVEMDPANPRPFRLRAEILKSLGKTKEAEEAEAQADELEKESARKSKS